MRPNERRRPASTVDTWPPTGDYNTWTVQALVYLPTEQEIAAACAEIRSAWSQAEHERRLVGYTPEHWTAPVIRSADLELSEAS